MACLPLVDFITVSPSSCPQTLSSPSILPPLVPSSLSLSDHLLRPSEGPAWMTDSRHGVTENGRLLIARPSGVTSSRPCVLLILEPGHINKSCGPSVCVSPPGPTSSGFLSVQITWSLKLRLSAEYQAGMERTG